MTYIQRKYIHGREKRGDIYRKRCIHKKDIYIEGTYTKRRHKNEKNTGRTFIQREHKYKGNIHTKKTYLKELTMRLCML